MQPVLDAERARGLRARYERDGFVVIEDAVGEEGLATLRGAVARLAAEHDPAEEREVFRTDDRDAGRDEAFFASARGVRGFLEAEALGPDGELVVPRDRCLNKIGHALHDLVPEVREFAQSALVREAFAVGGLAEALLVQAMVIFKQPGIGGEVRWHQDASYLLCEPQRVVGLWLALEGATRANGCLEVAPGAHRGPLRERYAVDPGSGEGVLRELDGTPWPEEGLSLEVRAGSLVVFHDHLPHRSAANRSGRSRAALTLHAHDVGSRWSADCWLQRGELGEFRIGG
jgi:phytanoyl-CoA hydroxylase